MIPRETGRGLSISGAHRFAAVERLVGATLVVALPPNGAAGRRPLLGHYRTGGAATQPGNDATPQGNQKGCPYGRRGLEVSKKKKGLSVGLLRPIAHRPWVALGSVLVLPATSAVGYASYLLPAERGLSLTTFN